MQEEVTQKTIALAREYSRREMLVYMELLRVKAVGSPTVFSLC